MRLILAISVLIALGASAEAAQAHRPTSPVRQQHPPRPTASSKGFAVPGWTDEQTRAWINDATGPRD
jgi:hypothetical protein